MANQLYENWWMNLTEPNCGIYYRGEWYSSEAVLNEHGYYIVYNRTLYLGESHQEYKYQNVYYLMDVDNYKTYAQVHALGYSEYVSYTYYFIKTSTLEYLEGYYNSTDGYYVEGVWYETLQELNTAGYQVGENHVYLYRKHELKRYDALVRVWNNIIQYFINDSVINYWFTESDMNSLDLQFLPSVELNWNLGTNFGNNVGHGGHGTYSISLYELLRNGESIHLTEMDSIFGYQPARTEYNCSGAYVGGYKTDAIGEKLWFECYNGSSSGTSRDNLIASFYMDEYERPIYSTSYMRYQRIAVSFENLDVVKIYDDCNLVYSAFKILYNNNTYYYPCDGVEREWILESELQNYNFFLSERNGVFKITTSAYINNVEIPQGYNILSIKSSLGYTYPTFVEDSDVDTVAYSGKDIYSKSVSKYMLQVRHDTLIYPKLYIIQGTATSEKGVLSGSPYTSSWNYSSDWTSFVETDVNNTKTGVGDYFVYLKGDSHGTITYANNGFPANFVTSQEFNSYNTDTNFFNLPTSLYRKNANVIEWLGNTDDTHGLAYYYYNKSVNIYLYTNNENDKVKLVEIMDIVNKNIQKIEFWPHRGYKYYSQFYTEEQLLNIGYHVINHSRRITAYFNTDGASEISAYYNITSNTTSFNIFSYTHIINVNNSPLLYDGSCDIIVEENSNNIVTRLQYMPSSTTTIYSNTIELYSVLTSQTNPRNPFNNDVIGHPLVFVLCSNYNTTCTYKAPIPLKLLIDPYKLPTFELKNTLNMSNNLEMVCYYNVQNGKYLVKEIGTYNNETTLRNAGYILYDSVFMVQQTSTHTLYNAYQRSTYGYYINNAFYATREDFEAAGYKEVVLEYTIDLNNQWVEADPITDASIIAQAGEGYSVVKSNSNWHVQSSNATMYINMLTNDAVIFKCMTRSESGYDYPIISMDGNTIFNGQNVTSFTSFTVSNAKGKRITVTYKKDYSVDNDLDRAFLALPDPK